LKGIIMSKFDDLIGNILTEADPPAPAGEETPPTGEEATPEVPETPPAPEKPDIDVGEITVKFTGLILDALRLGLRNSGLDSGGCREEIERLLEKDPITQEESVAVLDELEGLINRNITPSSPEYRAPGVS
jgi:hypothetical protein